MDDEPDILEFLSYNLKKEGYTVFAAGNGQTAIEIARKEKPRLIILDVMMPDMDGVETCQKIRGISELQNVIITFLTARNEDYSQIAGLEAGADDYITKPIKIKVLMSRIKALLRRSESKEPESKTIVIGNLKIDRDKYMVTRGKQEMNLPKKEFELLALLASKPNHVFTRDAILNNVWGEEVVVGDRTIDVHIRKLREKLGEDCIKTVKGIGYKFES